MSNRCNSCYAELFEDMGQNTVCAMERAKTPLLLGSSMISVISEAVASAFLS